MKEVGRFECAGEDGRSYAVIKRRPVITSGMPSGTHSEVLGAADYILNDGRAVSPSLDDDDTFVIVDTGTVIRRV